MVSVAASGQRTKTSPPSGLSTKAPGRAPIYCLDRAAVASLGVEGDLLLGWRGGEAILADLA